MRVTDLAIALFPLTTLVLVFQVIIGVGQAVLTPSFVSNRAEVVSKATHQDYHEVVDDVHTSLLSIYKKNSRFRSTVAPPLITLALFSVACGIAFVETQSNVERSSGTRAVTIKYCTRWHVVDYLLVLAILAQSVVLLVAAHDTWIFRCEVAMALASEFNSGPGSEPYDSLHEMACGDRILSIGAMFRFAPHFLAIGCLACTLVVLKNRSWESPDNS